VRKEQDELYKAKFLAKEQEQLTTDMLLKFDRGLIRLTDKGITLTQERQCKNLSIIDIRPAISTSARGVSRGLLTPKD
jgi:hypothetical protein